MAGRMAFGCGSSMKGRKMSLITVRLDRTIAAVRAELPEDEVAEFDEVMETTTVAVLPQAFERWFHRAVLNKVGVLEKIKAGRFLPAADAIPIDEAFPGARERWEAARGRAA